MFCYGTFTHTPTRKCVASLCGNGNRYSSGAEMHDGYSFNSPQRSWGEKEKRSSALALARPMTCRSLCLVRISYRMKPRPPFPRVHFASRAAQSRGASQQTSPRACSEGQRCTRRGQRAEESIPQYQQKAGRTVLSPASRPAGHLAVARGPWRTRAPVSLRGAGRWVVGRESWDPPQWLAPAARRLSKCSQAVRSKLGMDSMFLFMTGRN